MPRGQDKKSDLAERKRAVRVLVVMLRPKGSPARSTGGGQISMIQTAVGLSGLGTNVSMIEAKPSILFDSAQALDAHVLSGRRGTLRDIIGVRWTAKLSNSDIIFAFTDFFPETIIASFFAALTLRKRLFVNVTSTAYQADDGRRFLGLVRDRFRKRPVLGDLLAFATFNVSRRAAFRTGTCLVSSRYMESYVRTRLRGRRATIVGAGVENFWFESKDVPKQFDGVYTGRFDPSKRVPILIRAWKTVVERKPGARLLLIGESGEDLDEVKRLVVELGLQSNVVFSGFIDNRLVLADKVRSARVFVFPSVHEGFGLVVAEAMAAGLPCVISDVEPLRELFGEAALLVRPDDPSAFASEVLGLLLDEAKSQEYAARSTSLAKRFTWTSVAQKVLAAAEST